MKNFGETIGYMAPLGVVTALDLESAGVKSWFDRMTGSLYGSYFGIEFNGVNTTELAAALTEVNRQSDELVWSRFTIGRALPRPDGNALMRKLHGVRLY
jgi:hypothetical protein